MDWSRGDRSNIEDRRGDSPAVGGGGFSLGGRGVPMGIGGVLVLLLISWLTGTDPTSLLTDSGPVSSGAPARSAPPSSTSAAEERTVDFVDAVANDVQDMWASVLGSRYERTKVVLFREAVQSGCGVADAASGPFYCPEDRKVFLDLSFLDELNRRFGAPGEFARAYVIAHEFSHHVQHLTGYDRASAAGAGNASVAVELQADCLAGVWGHQASLRETATPGHVAVRSGDAAEALNAAAAIGDDRLQRMATGHVSPESFTHGTSAQRVDAFRRGMDSGDPRACGLGR
jgi:predicted metalloprotease